jgi:hypothetical protein
VLLDIVPDEDNPYATLSAKNADGDVLAEVKVSAGFKLTESSAQAWVERDFLRPSK